MHVRDNMIEWDVILTHQFGCELGGAVNGDSEIVAPVYTHFDTDRGSVSPAFVVGMLSGFVSGEGLVNRVIVHREMPSEKPSPIMAGPDPFIHGKRMMKCIGATGRVIRRVNSDKCRPHRPVQSSSAFPWGNNGLGNFQLACTGRSRAPNLREPRGLRAGRQQKSHRNNAQKPKRAKFHRRKVSLAKYYTPVCRVSIGLREKEHGLRPRNPAERFSAPLLRRKNMGNFSTWNRLSAEKQAEAVHESWEEVAEGKMPTWYYVAVHPEARLSAADKSALRAWALSVRDNEGR